MRIGRLDSVVAWRKEIGKLYRAVRRGEMPADIGTKLAYVAGVAAKLVQVEEELRQRDRIAAELERLGAATGHSLTYASDPEPVVDIAGARAAVEVAP